MRTILEQLDSMLSKTIEQLETQLIDNQDLTDTDQEYLQDYIDSLENERYDVNELLEEIS